MTTARDLSRPRPRGAHRGPNDMDPARMRTLKEQERHERNLFEHGKRRGRYEADDQATGPAPAEPTGLSPEHHAIYRNGVDEGRAEHEQKVHAAKKATLRRQGKRATRRVRTSIRQPAESAGPVTQLWHVVVVSLVMVVLYLALTSATGVGQAVGGVQKAIAWLVSPTATI